MTQISFSQALAKGAVGERIIKKIMEAKGWITYQPTTENKAHTFDMMAIKGKKIAIALDVKAKGRMNKWRATGVNQRHFDEYAAFSEKHSMDFYIIFVDEMLGKIYGNSISNLEKPMIAENTQWPWVMRAGKSKIRLWHLDQMTDICDLEQADIDELKSLNQRKHDFKPKD